MKTNLIEVNYCGVLLELKFTIYGKFIPATMEYQAEYPEFEIIEVLANDLNIFPILLEDQMEDLYNLLNENY